MAQANGPRVGKGSGRFRNTLVNNASKRYPGQKPRPGQTPPILSRPHPTPAPSPTGPAMPTGGGAGGGGGGLPGLPSVGGVGGGAGLPVVSPGSAVGYAGQTAAATMTLYQRLAAIRAQRGLIKGQFQMAKADIKAQEIGGLAATEQSATERGILGSSGDLSNRIGVESSATSAIQDAMQQRLQGRLGLASDRISATSDYLTSLFQIQAEKTAERQTMATEAFMNDLVLRLGDETEGLGAARGPTGVSTPGSGGYHAPRGLGNRRVTPQDYEAVRQAYVRSGMTPEGAARLARATTMIGA